MQRANQWRIRDEEEYTIALAYLRRSFDKSPSLWRDSNHKDQAREALQGFDGVLLVDKEEFDLLKAEGISVSNVTIQKILIKHDLGSRYERWLALEQKYAKSKIKLTKPNAPIWATGTTAVHRWKR